METLTRMVLARFTRFASALPFCLALAGPTLPAAAQDAGGAPPPGYYECYFFGLSGLTNSSMVDMSIVDSNGYEALGESGEYSFDPSTGTLRMTGGALAGRVAHMEESSGQPAIVFLRDENEIDGEPTIDTSDTWCYFEPR